MSDPARRERVIHLWNTTTWPASRIAVEIGGLSRAAVCGIIHRTPKELITRKLQRRAPLRRKEGHAWSRKQAAARRNWNTQTNRPPDDPELQPQERLRLLPPVDEAAMKHTMPEAIVGLQLHQCRWPVEKNDRFAFCDDPSIEGSSYCADHWQRSLRRFRRYEEN